MAETTILELRSCTGIDYDNDQILGVDVSDHSETGDGSTVRFTPKVILKGKDLPDGDIVGTSDEQTLTGKTENSPKINENVVLTSTSTEINQLHNTNIQSSDISKLHDITSSASEINQLDGVTVGGNNNGDILTTDDSQVESNKTLENPKLQGQLKALPQTTSAGLVTFFFDDGPATDYTTIYPLFTTQNEVGAVCMVTDIADGGASLTYAQALEMQNNGWEVCNHTKDHTHLTTLTEAQIVDEIEDSQARFVANGLNPVIIAYPYNASNALVRKMARKYFRAARAGGDVVNPDPLNTFMISSVECDDWTQLSTYESLVDRAHREGKWLCFYGHSAGYDAGELTSLNTLIDYIQSVGIPIVTPSTALDLIDNYIETGDSFGVSERKIRMTAQSIHPEFHLDGGSAQVIANTAINGTSIELGTAGTAELDLSQAIVLPLTNSTIMFDIKLSDATKDPTVFKDSSAANYIRWRGSLGSLYLYGDASHIATWSGIGSYFVNNTVTHVAITISNSKATLYLNGVSQGEHATVFSSAFSMNRIVNLLTTTSVILNNIRVWNATLTQQQIWDEMYSDYAVNTTSMTKQYNGTHYLGTAAAPTYFGNIKQIDLLLR